MHPPNVHCSVIYNSQDMEASSTDEWIKMWYLYIVEYYSATKKNANFPFATTWIDLNGTMLSEISLTEKDKYSIISLICGT